MGPVPMLAAMVSFVSARNRTSGPARRCQYRWRAPSKGSPQHAVHPPGYTLCRAPRPAGSTLLTLGEIRKVPEVWMRPSPRMTKAPSSLANSTMASWISGFVSLRRSSSWPWTGLGISCLEFSRTLTVIASINMAPGRFPQRAARPILQAIVMAISRTLGWIASVSLRKSEIERRSTECSTSVKTTRSHSSWWISQQRVAGRFIWLSCKIKMLPPAGLDLGLNNDIDPSVDGTTFFCFIGSQRLWRAIANSSDSAIWQCFVCQ